MNSNPELARVGEYRAAARQILRDAALDDDRRTDALMRLYLRAKEEPDAEFAIGAIVAEIAWDIDRDDLGDETRPGDPEERAHRRLRGLGHERCPECRSTLSTAADWDRWRQLRLAAIAELEAREAAAS